MSGILVEIAQISLSQEFHDHGIVIVTVNMNIQVILLRPSQFNYQGTKKVESKVRLLVFKGISLINLSIVDERVTQYIIASFRVNKQSNFLEVSQLLQYIVRDDIRDDVAPRLLQNLLRVRKCSLYARHIQSASSATHLRGNWYFIDALFIHCKDDVIVGDNEETKEPKVPLISQARPQ